MSNADLTPPPDTVQMQNAHRAALKEAQGAAFSMDAYATATPLETPAFVGRGVSFAEPMSPAALASSVDRVRDVLLYADPPVSYLVAIVGVVILAVGHILLSGVHNVTLLTAVSFALLGKLGINFLRGLVSRDWQQASNWQGSTFGRALTERAGAAAEGLSWVHDRFLASDDPVTSLRVAAGLWALAVLGRWLSIWSVVSLVFVGAFTLPAAYLKHQATMQATYANITAAVKERWNNVLSRKQKLAVLAILLLVAFVHSSWATRLVALLLGALAVRCHLKPAEVQRIMQIAEPYTLTVRKQTRRVSMAATDFALRSLGGKHHFG